MIKDEMTSENESNGGMGLLGEYLKQKRLDKNYSLEKLSQKTKISINILKSLEANDFDHLPSAAYIKGFVTNYVKVLGIPMDEAINKMEYTYLNVLGKPFPALNHTKAMSSRPSQKSPTVDGPSPHEVIESSDSIITNTKSVIPVAILAVVILVFVGGYKLISSVIENEVHGQKNADLGPKIESSSALVKEPKQEPEAQKPAETAKAESPEPVTPAVEEKKDESEELAPAFERNFPVVDFRKIRGKLFTVKTDAPENDDTSLIPETFKEAMNPNLQNVYIRALEGNTWLSYKIDAQPIESVIVNKGSDLFLQGNEIRVFLGNVNVTRIFYNNYLIDTPTRSGVKSLVFPEEGNAKFMLPLFPKANDDILYTSDEYMKRMKLEEEELQKRKAD